MEINRTSPERLIIGSALLANGGSYLYNLLLGHIMGPENFMLKAHTITLIIYFIFLGFLVRLAWGRLGRLFNLTSTSLITNTMGCRITFALLAVLGILFFSEDFTAYFTLQEAGISLGIGIAFPVCMMKKILPKKLQPLFFGNIKRVSREHTKKTIFLLLLIAAYELAHIFLKNSDILLVRQYFSQTEATLYTSIALVGRGIYLIAWIFLIVIATKFVNYKKSGVLTATVIKKYIMRTALLLMGLLMVCYLFPEQIINYLFGPEYLSVASFLWQHALTTSLFIMANIFTYYFMFLEEYLPILFSVLVGIVQMLLMSIFNSSMDLVVQLQIVAMVALLTANVIFFYSRTIR